LEKRNKREYVDYINFIKKSGMTVLVVGASGATERKLVEQLLIEKHEVKAIVKSPEKLPESCTKGPNLNLRLEHYKSKQIIYFYSKWSFCANSRCPLYLT